MSTLYLVATPIGNLKDITERALDTLRAVDTIFCEDTTVSIKLLNHFGIRKPLHSYYKPKERERLPHIIGLLDDGRDIALISDAGTPLVADPGHLLVQAARDAGHAVVPVPGASSVTAAIAAAGFGDGRFVFEGFLPKKAREIRDRLEPLKTLPHCIVAFVPGRDIDDVLGVLGELFGDRRICVARELTKLHEEFAIGTSAELLAKGIVQKGEAVIVIDGAPPPAGPDIEAAREFLASQSAAGRTLKDLAGAPELAGFKRNEIYRLWEEIRHGS